MESDSELHLSGERFTARYRLHGDAAADRARDICLEQTVEVPAEVVPAAIAAQVVGRVERLTEVDADTHLAEISFAAECAGTELPQLINVLFGNLSLKPDIRLEGVTLPDSLAALLGGPRFGRRGLRDLFGAPRRPLVAAALKPMGLSPRALAALAGALARGGVDLIKDDHGLCDQPLCPFDERVARCAEAVTEANSHTGRKSRYFANTTAPARELHDRARHAKRLGAGGLVVAPGIVGFDTMRALACDAELELPILSHPALLGALTLHPRSGMSHGVLYGQLMRLAGADGTIFPSFGGRFSFTPEQCRDLVSGTTVSMGAIDAAFPVPAGGMTLDRVGELRAFYGEEAIFLVGGDLLRQASDIEGAAQRLVERVTAAG